MMKEVVQAMQAGYLAQIGLIAFLFAFTMILIYTFTLSRRRRDEAKQLPLDDDNELFTPHGKN